MRRLKTIIVRGTLVISGEVTPKTIKSHTRPSYRSRSLRRELGLSQTETLQDSYLFVELPRGPAVPAHKLYYYSFV